jgi:hypothetical protein
MPETRIALVTGATAGLWCEIVAPACEFLA